MSTPSQELPQRDLTFREGLAGFSLTLKRNCSISPAGLLCVFAALSIVAVAIGIGIGFAIAGAWLILPFAGLEVAMLGRHLDAGSRAEFAAELFRRLRT